LQADSNNVHAPQTRTRIPPSFRKSEEQRGPNCVDKTVSVTLLRKTTRFLLAIQEKLACDIWLAQEKYFFFFAWRC
jgi:hypothetical protein